jgi:putative protease
VLEEDGDYSYIMNSRDLCMIEHIPALLCSGVSALKIEGRMRSPYYVASVTRVYREAVDRYCADPEGYRPDPAWKAELARTGTRGFTTGFFFGNPMEEGQIYDIEHSSIDQSFAGIVATAKRADGLVTIKAKNPVSERTRLVRLGARPAMDTEVDVLEIFDSEGMRTGKTRPNETALVRLNNPVREGEILRKA